MSNNDKKIYISARTFARHIFESFLSTYLIMQVVACVKVFFKGYISCKFFFCFLNRKFPEIVVMNLCVKNGVIRSKLK